MELHVGERVRERGLSEVMSEVVDLRWGVDVLSTVMEPLQVVRQWDGDLPPIVGPAHSAHWKQKPESGTEMRSKN